VAKTVLVIDDDSSVRDAFELTLTELGYRVELASDGSEGLARVANSRPDLIFLDLNMPCMDGVQVMLKLREMDRTLKVYIVTAFAREFMDRLNSAVAAGCHFEMAAKPLSAEQIGMIAAATIGK